MDKANAQAQSEVRRSTRSHGDRSLLHEHALCWGGFAWLNASGDAHITHWILTVHPSPGTRANVLVCSYVAFRRLVLLPFMTVADPALILVRSCSHPWHRCRVTLSSRSGAAAHRIVAMGGAQPSASRKLQRVSAEDRHLTGLQRHRASIRTSTDLRRRFRPKHEQRSSWARQYRFHTEKGARPIL